MAKRKKEPDYEGRDRYEMDVDRMINEGLAGGQVSMQNGLIDEARSLDDDGNPSQKQKK